MHMEKQRNYTCCFTGHRKLEHSEKEIREKTYKLIIKLIKKNGCTHFITGGALGFDTIAAEIVLALRKKLFSHITLEIAMPCSNQNIYWTHEQKLKYEKILKEADKQTLVNKAYTSYAMQKRNEYMVDNSNFIIAYFNNKPSGTKNMIEYAKKQKKDVFCLKFAKAK